MLLLDKSITDAIEEIVLKQDRTAEVRRERDNIVVIAINRKVKIKVPKDS